MAIVSANDNDMMVLPAAEPLLIDTNVYQAIASDNGNFVAFRQSYYRWFKADLTTDTKTSINITLNPYEISDNGRYILLKSEILSTINGINLPIDAVSLLDTQTGTSTVVSVADNEATADNRSYPGAMSNDARFVAFESEATNLVTGDSNGEIDVFLRDTQAGTTIRVSVANNEAQANSSSDIESISDNGRYVLFSSHASNLVTGDTNNAMDLFVRDIVSGTTKRVSLADNEAQANGSSGYYGNPSISNDGRYVIFESDATNLVPGVSRSGLFIRDTVNNTTQRADLANDGSIITGSSLQDASPNGRFVLFSDEAGLYVRDTVSKLTASIVSEPGSSFKGGDAQISADGKYIFGVYSDSHSSASLLRLENPLISFETLQGGAGDDLYVVDRGATIVEAAGAGWDTVQTGLSVFALSANVEELEYSGTGDFMGIGNTQANRITGGDGRDSLLGRDGNDMLLGLDGNDRLEGGAGADTLDGGTGRDSLIGGDGNDIYYATIGDVIQETNTAASGIDTVKAWTSWGLGANLENLTLLGTAFNGIGNWLDNQIAGNDAGNSLAGKGGADILSGAAGNDALSCGAGNDKLTGGLGLDTFIFNTALGSANVDTLQDFKAVDDTIRLDRTVFTALTVGALPATAFVANATGVAADSGDRIVYNTTSGNVLYDADGTGPAAAVAFVTLVGAPAITAADFQAV